jgi:DNA invertase Pin-like site-specific DNA recombinase
VSFKGWGKNTWWIDDEDCNCETSINEYFARQKMVRVPVVYCICRVSSKNQTGPTHVSLDVQETRLRDIANRMFSSGVRVKVVRISASAYKGIPRKMMNILESTCSEDAILIYRVDRLSRNIFMFLDWLEKLNGKNVKIFAHDEQMWYHEKKLEFVQSLLDANKEAALISRRVRSSIDYRRSRGDEVFGSLPYGWMSQRVPCESKEHERETRLVRVENPEEQKVIRRILTSSSSYEVLANILNRNGQLKRGRLWTEKSIASISMPKSKKSKK